MRNILFRGKAINRDPDREYRTSYKNGDWVYGLVSKLHDEQYDFPAEMTNEIGVSGIDVDYRTIGEWTGMTDKNGVKIFEGDIVANTLINKCGCVAWDSNCAAFVVTLDGTRYGLSTVEGNIYEVVANIYYPPYLL